MDRTQEFMEAVAATEESADLERLVVLIAAHARPGLDVDQVIGHLDDLATRVETGELGSLRQVLFGDLGFIGDSESYYDPENSYLDSVISRRKGIPITLSILTIAVGSRAGVPLEAVGMPGHFLVKVTGLPDLFLDPFSGGSLLDVDGCRQMYQRIHGTEDGFGSHLLRPIGAYSIVERMLNNLLAIFRSGSDPRSQLWVARLRASLPQATVLHRADVATALARGGRFDDAADMFDSLAAASDPDTAVSLRAARDRMRSLMN